MTTQVTILNHGPDDILIAHYASPSPMRLSPNQFFIVHCYKENDIKIEEIKTEVKH